MVPEIRQAVPLLIQNNIYGEEVEQNLSSELGSDSGPKTVPNFRLHFWTLNLRPKTD